MEGSSAQGQQNINMNIDADGSLGKDLNDDDSFPNINVAGEPVVFPAELNLDADESLKEVDDGIDDVPSVNKGDGMVGSPMDMALKPDSSLSKDHGSVSLNDEEVVLS